MRYGILTKFAAPYSKTARFLSAINPFPKSKNLSRGDALCLCLQDLGPIFVKFGQSLSTRPDLFPKDIVDALACLRDQVKPFDEDVAKKIIETSLGKPVDHVFKRFDQKPLASASVAQVHSASLYDDSEVIIKGSSGVEIASGSDVTMSAAEAFVLASTNASVSMYGRDSIVFNSTAGNVEVASHTSQKIVLCRTPSTWSICVGIVICRRRRYPRPSKLVILQEKDTIYIQRRLYHRGNHSY